MTNIDVRAIKQELRKVLDELQRITEDASGAAAPKIKHQFFYAKMPPHSCGTISLANFEKRWTKRKEHAVILKKKDSIKHKTGN